MGPKKRSSSKQTESSDTKNKIRKQTSKLEMICEENNADSGAPELPVPGDDETVPRNAPIKIINYKAASNTSKTSKMLHESGIQIVETNDPRAIRQNEKEEEKLIPEIQNLILHGASKELSSEETDSGEQTDEEMSNADEKSPQSSDFTADERLLIKVEQTPAIVVEAQKKLLKMPTGDNVQPGPSGTSSSSSSSGSGTKRKTPPHQPDYDDSSSDEEGESREDRKRKMERADLEVVRKIAAREREQQNLPEVVEEEELPQVPFQDLISWEAFVATVQEAVERENWPWRIWSCRTNSEVWKKGIF